MSKFECRRSTLYALQHKISNSLNKAALDPPSTNAMAGVNTNGARSRRTPSFFLKLPKKWLFGPPPPRVRLRPAAPAGPPARTQNQCGRAGRPS
jgi:hypothetical protein